MRGIGERQVLRHAGEAVVGPEAVPRPRQVPVAPPEVGPEQVHHLQLLHRPDPVPDPAARVQEGQGHMI
ncbi:hypothetical protein SASPL_119046 [Salvia splendens]|uniref:Uncharacterized protein n=1 Tax=Salvia splendens TaxID=180675 RepID=A0A8X9A0H9_SALSN|nr:hypothetical protein SASPL_119046 [Salvia splendens]